MTLPAFLLTYADSNLVWAGCKKFALPAVNARWSLARVLVLTVAQILFGLVVACALSLLIFRQPVGWIFWFLGLMSACQGIVCLTLTALCWNQRVARLKEDPTLPLRLPPARYVLARWALGLVYFVVLALITPLAMVVTIQNVYGQMVWRREQAGLVAQGERLTFREILGPEIPAEDNAGTAPIFRAFFDYDTHAVARHPEAEYSQTDIVTVLRGQSSNAVVRIKEGLFLPFNRLPEKPKPAPNIPKRPENMADWSAAYRELVASPKNDDPSWATALKLPAPGDPARDVRAGLAVGDAVVAELCAASARPRAQMPVHWNEAFSVLLPHLAVLKSAQQNLKLRCAAHLAAGETDAAFAVATNALNVAELLREEPLLISQLVRMAQGAIAVSTVWEGWAQHRWTDAQLAVFQERLSRMDYPAGLIRGFEGERAGGIVGLNALIAGTVPGEQPGVGGLRRAAMVVPLGVLRENQVAVVRAHTRMLADLRSHIAQAPQTGFAMLTDLTGKRTEDELGTSYSPFTALAKMLVPALARAETKAARSQTTMNLAITVCALERHRLAHGSYPEALDALVPAFMSKSLPDPMSGQAFHYRRTDDGWFLLYSVGEDGQDDDGVFRAKPKDTIKDWPWPVPTRAEAGSLF